ncbi:histidine--tRNA ligase [Nitrospinae bacterium AH_259_B05_G02_I21]|nr:histidine--tRNA ligase [Nitrospinae bacterium AH_259_B05_G02_I21]
MSLRAVRGVKDILPGEVELWEVVEAEARRLFKTFGYAEIKIPVFEHTSLFARSLGETTDIVQKEMYTFEDRGGDSITLRPEATASLVRAYIEHNLFHPPRLLKVFTIGPMFRYERPQAGRFRQFYQVNAEAFGSDNPAVDAEILVFVDKLLRALHLDDLEVRLNSLGDEACRPRYTEALTAFLQRRRDALCEDCDQRIDLNPMRVFDCKTPGCQELKEAAPTIGEYLCEACVDHFEQVKAHLARVDIPVHLDPQLVRGLDYYTRTTFEVVSARLGAQDAVCGGGRYDGLVEALGGPPTPAIGFAIGIERLVSLLDRSRLPLDEGTPQLFIATVGEGVDEVAFEIMHALRSASIRVEREYESRSLKAQMKVADRSKAQYTLILGGDELARGAALLRNMAASSQEEIALDSLVEEIKARLALP